MGSLKDAVGRTGYAVLNIVDPNGVVIRNCMCFAMIRGAFDYGIRVSVGSPNSPSLFLSKHTDRGADQLEIDLVLPHDLLRNPSAQVPR